MTTNNPPVDGESDAEPAAPSEATSVAVDDLLPPVEEPSAGFIIQLFVLPALIVAGVVLLWMTINWLAHRGAQDPEQIVRSLNSSNQARFQEAKELADMLRMPKAYGLNSDAVLCEALAKLLAEMVEAGSDAESEVTMRYILAGALGEFYVDDGLETLITAAREDPERDIRRRAVNAIAVLGQTFVSRTPPEGLDHPDLLSTLFELANQPDDELLRSEAAFTLGVLAQAPDVDARVLDELILLTEDFYPDARYNAATGLARIGDLHAVETIAEMLNLETIQTSVQGEKKFDERVSPTSLARQRSEKRDLILKNAIRAINSLLDHHSPDRLLPLKTALDEFLRSTDDAPDNPWQIPESLVGAAKKTSKRFDEPR